MRYPSSLISCAHRSPSGTVSASWLSCGAILVGKPVIGSVERALAGAGSMMLACRRRSIRIALHLLPRGVVPDRRKTWNKNFMDRKANGPLRYCLSRPPPS